MLRKLFRFFPIPNEVELSDDKEEFQVTKETIIEVEGISTEIDVDLSLVIGKINEQISRMTENNMDLDTVPTYDSILISILRSNIPLKYGIDESYTLISLKSKIINIKSENVFGAIKGLWTLFWLIVHNKGQIPVGLKISDSPLYSHRGVLLDVTRHFIPMDLLRRIAIVLSSLKYNVIHLHLSDDQSYRLESEKFPQLTQGKRFYTISSMKNFTKFSRNLGIRIIPEIDIPGHCSEIIRTFVDLASHTVPERQVKKFGIFRPVLNPIKEETYKFLDDLFGEICKIFPDEFFHIGGDEIDSKDWTKNNEIQNYKSQNRVNDKKLHHYFVRRVYEQILSKYGKKIVCWDEVMDEKLSQDLEGKIYFQRWKRRSKGSGNEECIISSGYYLDHLDPAEAYYCRIPSVFLRDSKSIIGCEACCWTEFITEENIESRLFPLCACISERFWSKRSNNNNIGSSLFSKKSIETQNKKKKKNNNNNFMVPSEDIDFMYYRLYTFFDDLIPSLFGCLQKNEQFIERLCPSEEERFLVSLLEPSWGGFNKNHLRSTLKYSTDHQFNELIDYCPTESRATWNLFLLTRKYLENRNNKNLFLEYRDELVQFYEKIYFLIQPHQVHQLLLEIFEKRLKRYSEIALICLGSKKVVKKKKFKKKKVLEELGLMEREFIGAFHVPLVFCVKVLVEFHFSNNKFKFKVPNKMRRINKIFPMGGKK